MKQEIIQIYNAVQVFKFIKCWSDSQEVLPFTSVANSVINFYQV